MVSYILNSINGTEKTIRKIGKKLCHQKIFSIIIAMLAVGTTIQMVEFDNIIRNHEGKINALRNEIDELKNRKETTEL